jgi:hypothetical protein
MRPPASSIVSTGHSSHSVSQASEGSRFPRSCSVTSWCTLSSSTAACTGGCCPLAGRARRLEGDRAGGCPRAARGGPEPDPSDGVRHPPHRRVARLASRCRKAAGPPRGGGPAFTSGHGVAPPVGDTSAGAHPFVPSLYLGATGQPEGPSHRGPGGPPAVLGLRPRRPSSSSALSGTRPSVARVVAVTKVVLFHSAGADARVPRVRRRAALGRSHDPRAGPVPGRRSEPWTRARPRAGGGFRGDRPSRCGGLPMSCTRASRA